MEGRAGIDIETKHKGGRNMTPGGGPVKSQQTRERIVLAALALSCAAIYLRLTLPSLHAGWLPLDDLPQLYHIRGGRHLGDLLGRDVFGFFRPMKNLLFVGFDMLSQWGMAGVRLLAICVGACSAAGIYWFLVSLFRSQTWALVGTMLWLLSPTTLCGICWLSAVNITAMTGLIGSAGAMRELALMRRGVRGCVWGLGAVGCLVLALACYEGAVAAVPAFVALDLFLHPERFTSRVGTLRRRVVALHLVYLGIIAVYLGAYPLLRGAGAIHGGKFSGASAAEASFASAYFFLQHLWAWVWPFGRMAVLGAYISGEVPLWRLVSSWIILAGLAVATVGLRRRHPVCSFGVAWFLICFTPMSNILGSRSGPYGEYYLILPSVGLAAAATQCLRRLFAGIGRTLTLLRISAGLGLLAWRLAAVAEAAVRADIWTSPAAIWERTLRTFPNAFGAMVELAKLRVAAGDYVGADSLLQKALEIAPDLSGALAVKAVVTDRTGDPLKALGYVERLLQDQPGNPWALRFKGYLYEDRLGRPEEAGELYRRAVQRRPWNLYSVDAAQAWACWLATRGRRKEAIQLWEECLRYAPHDPVIHYNLATAYRQEGLSPDQAARHAAEAAKHGLRGAPGPPGGQRR
ncbi:MAG TPA: tetratricopeptide repeat protein [Kiritimatiellae bacterium]|nr:tetratricopeptide repeat protein [Kiritimatiellia bacterium]